MVKAKGVALGWHGIGFAEWFRGRRRPRTARRNGSQFFDPVVSGLVRK